MRRGYLNVFAANYGIRCIVLQTRQQKTDQRRACGPVTERSRFRQPPAVEGRCPRPHEDAPRVLPIGKTAGSTAEHPAGATAGGTSRPLTRAALHTIVKSVFEQAAQRDRGGANTASAKVLEQASAH